MSNTTSNLRNIPIVTTILIAINVLVFVIMYMVPSSQINQLYNAGVLSVSALMQGHWWTLVTSMFLHGGFAHILCNMISLYYLGSMTEAVFGKGKYLILYFASGIIGGLAYCGWNIMTGDTTGAVGASGAIFGLFGAYGYLLLRESKQNRIFVMKPGTQDLTSYGIMLAINIVFGLTSPGIANEAHIGGMLSGFIIAAIMYPMILKRFGR